jgi:serine protease Do
MFDFLGFRESEMQTNQYRARMAPIVIRMKQRLSSGLLAALVSIPCIFTTDAAPSPNLKTDPTPLSQSERAAGSFAPVIRQVSPSVVNIYTNKIARSAPGGEPYENPVMPFFGFPQGQIPRQRLEQSLGSGVIVSRDGYILTNHHVIEGADQIRVSLHDNETTYDARLVGTDPQTDIAVIKIEMKEAPAITLADSDLVEVGDIALAIGNPFGIGQTVTMGIVSAKGRRGMGIVDYEDFIQTDASINPGNSGGALVDAKGRLIGINQSILSRSGGNQGVGFSVPINLAKHVMASIVANGRVERGHLGVTIQPVTAELAEAFGLKGKNGALIAEVAPGSPAEEAGILAGDVILEIDGRKVEGSADLRLMVSKMTPGSQVSAIVLRDGAEKKLEVRVGSLTKAQNSAPVLNGAASALAGLQVQDLERSLRQRLGIPPRLSGALVSGIEPNSPAALTGLQPGDVIFEINRQPVGTAQEFLQAAKLAEGRRLLLRVWSRGAVRYLVLE